MTQILDALHLIFTGVAPGDIPEKGDFWQPCILPGLLGLNVIMGFDRANGPMPDTAFPYLLIEPSAIIPGPVLGAKKASIIFDVGVRQTGRLGARLGNGKAKGIADYATALDAYLSDNQALRTPDGKAHASGITVQSLDFSAKGSTSGPWSAKRYATLQVEINYRRH